MAREGLMDDCGFKGYDVEPPCEECKHCYTFEENGKLFADCELDFCDFEEYDGEE